MKFGTIAVINQVIIQESEVVKMCKLKIADFYYGAFLSALLNTPDGRPPLFDDDDAPPPFEDAPPVPPMVRPEEMPTGFLADFFARLLLGRKF